MDLYLRPDLIKSEVTKPEEGEDFGKPVSTRDPDKCVGDEISHLVKDKDYEQKRAVAAAYSICKHPDKKKSIDLVLER